MTTHNESSDEVPEEPDEETAELELLLHEAGVIVSGIAKPNPEALRKALAATKPVSQTIESAVIDSVRRMAS